MLDQAEREKIRLEEEYRLEVRNRLQEKPRKKSILSRSWDLVNSTFGLWLLSAICITWLGSIYTQRQSTRAEILKKEEVVWTETLKNKELIQRLDLEIAYRLSQIQLGLYSLNIPRRAGEVAGSTQQGIIKVLDSISQQPGKDFFALYTEYSNFSLLALVAELRRHTEGDERDRLDRVLADLSGIYVLIEVEGVNIRPIALDGSDRVYKVAGSDEVKRVAGIMHKRIISLRWLRGFYFLDCSEESPFC